MSARTTYTCDGCGKTEGVKLNAAPMSIKPDVRIELTDFVSHLRAFQRTVHVDLCDGCQRRLSEVSDPRRWTRAELQTA